MTATTTTPIETARLYYTPERQPLPPQWVVVLDEYEAVNLRALMAMVATHGTPNGGDWVNQVLFKLPETDQGQKPNEIYSGQGAGNNFHGCICPDCSAR